MSINSFSRHEWLHGVAYSVLFRCRIFLWWTVGFDSGNHIFFFDDGLSALGWLWVWWLDFWVSPVIGVVGCWVRRDSWMWVEVDYVFRLDEISTDDGALWCRWYGDEDKVGNYGIKSRVCAVVIRIRSRLGRWTLSVGKIFDVEVWQGALDFDFGACQFPAIISDGRRLSDAWNPCCWGIARVFSRKTKPTCV